MKQKLNACAFLGLLTGIVIVIFGLIILNRKVEFGSLHDTSNFYTEIYQLLRLGLGFILIGFGLTDIFYFGRNMYDNYYDEPQNVPSHKNNTNNNDSKSNSKKTDSSDSLPYI